MKFFVVLSSLLFLVPEIVNDVKMDNHQKIDPRTMGDAFFFGVWVSLMKLPTILFLESKKGFFEQLILCQSHSESSTPCLSSPGKGLESCFEVSAVDTLDVQLQSLRLINRKVPS
jgi:hypothetical protein